MSGRTSAGAGWPTGGDKGAGRPWQAGRDGVERGGEAS